MDDNKKREQIRRYFDPRKTPPALIWMAIVGALMVFFVLAMQCMSTVAMVRRETYGTTGPLP